MYYLLIHLFLIHLLLCTGLMEGLGKSFLESNISQHWDISIKLGITLENQ